MQHLYASVIEYILYLKKVIFLNFTEIFLESAKNMKNMVKISKSNHSTDSSLDIKVYCYNYQ